MLSIERIVDATYFLRCIKPFKNSILDCSLSTHKKQPVKSEMSGAEATDTVNACFIITSCACINAPQKALWCNLFRRARFFTPVFRHRYLEAQEHQSMRIVNTEGSNHSYSVGSELYDKLLETTSSMTTNVNSGRGD
jgi:hypothetical protein